MAEKEGRKKIYLLIIILIVIFIIIIVYFAGMTMYCTSGSRNKLLIAAATGCIGISSQVVSANTNTQEVVVKRTGDRGIDKVKTDFDICEYNSYFQRYKEVNYYSRLYINDELIEFVSPELEENDKEYTFKLPSGTIKPGDKIVSRITLEGMRRNICPLESNKFVVE